MIYYGGMQKILCLDFFSCTLVLSFFANSEIIFTSFTQFTFSLESIHNLLLVTIDFQMIRLLACTHSLLENAMPIISYKKNCSFLSTVIFSIAITAALQTNFRSFINISQYVIIHLHFFSLKINQE